MIAPVSEYDMPRSVSRNATDRSRLCESLVRSFIRSGFEAASVDWRESPYTLPGLYRGLSNTCSKSAYRGRVRVRKAEQDLCLVRLR